MKVTQWMKVAVLVTLDSHLKAKQPFTFDIKTKNSDKKKATVRCGK
jgi:hypothetical protein